MGENNRDESGNTTTAVGDVTWIKRKSKLWVPKHSKSDWLRSGFKGKTSWDWLQILLQLLTALALPVALFLAAQWFTTQQNRASEMAAATRYANDQQLAADQQRETTLETYLDKMSDLLTSKDLNDPVIGSEIRVIVQARTLTVLKSLDSPRIPIVLRFLLQSNVILKDRPIISLSSLVLIRPDLTGIDLSYADLRGAKLPGAILRNAILFATNLSQIDLSGANLSGANLSDAYLSRANLSRADLSGADLSDANLSGAYLYQANLSRAYLYQANLSGTHDLTQQQLDQVYTCKGAILPEGLTCHHNQ